MKTNYTKGKILTLLLFTGSLFINIFPLFAKNSASLEFSFVTKDYNGSSESCYGANDAQLTILATGGTGVYQYSIDNGAHFSTGNVFSNLKTGQNYQLVVKDNGGHQTSAQWVYIGKISNPITLQINNIQMATCTASKDGYVEAGAWGGSGTISFSIDNGATFQPSGRFENLAAGTYTIIAKDINGCQVENKTVTVPAGAGVTVESYYQEDYNCGGWGRGRIEFGGNGGKAPYTYYVDGKLSQNQVDALPVGKHVLSVTDAAGCSSSKEITINAPYTATLSGDTTIAPDEMANLIIAIDDASATSSSTYLITYKNSGGTVYTKDNLKNGLNMISVTVGEITTYTLLSVEKTSCKGAVSGSAVITIDDAFIWKGVNTNWNDIDNWNKKEIPTLSADVRIPATANNPVVSTVGSAKTVTIESGAKLSIPGTLNLASQITSVENQTVDAEAGTLYYCGDAKQNINGSVFKNYAIRNMIIGNNTELADSLNVFGTINFNGSNNIFYTNNHLTLKSTDEYTASVGQIINGNRISGEVTVEQYFPAKKGWKFLSVATEPGQSIHDAWQEGQLAGNTTGITGFGMQLTGTMSDWATKGFDGQSASPSIKTYDINTGLWKELAATLKPFDEPTNSYMVFLRGDRSADLTTSAETPTVLRSKGVLKYGDQEVVNVPAGKFVAIGNPFPSAIDMTKIQTANDMFFYVWDPNLGDGYGAYQTFVKIDAGNFMAVPGAGTYSTLSENVIPAGQAFFVFNADGGSVQLSETSKAITDNIQVGARNMDAGSADNTGHLNIRLYKVNTDQTTVLVDGILQNFNPSFSDDINGSDALKLANTGENLSIKRNGSLLAVESRLLNDQPDTTQLSISQMGYNNYRFIIEYDQYYETREVILKDNYTGRQTTISLTGQTQYDFQVDGTEDSYAAGRFEIIFAPYRVMPVTFTSFTAEKKQQNTQLTWTVENEVNVASYVVERSADAEKFEPIGKVNAAKKYSYQFVDEYPTDGTNYYRIASTDVDGKKQYTQVIKVNFASQNKPATVYPNPIAGNDINIRFDAPVNGTYYIVLLNQMGQVMERRQIELTSTTGNYTLQPLRKLAPGAYTIDLTHPSGDHSVIRILK